MNEIYAYDNNTGIELPSSIGKFNIEYLLGKSVSDVHDSIKVGSMLFLITTHVADADIVVQTEKDKEIIHNILSFGGYDKTVSVKEKSIWYTNKAKKVLVLSDTLGFTDEQYSVLISMYISMAGIETVVPVYTDMYTVKNTRSNSVLLKTPKYSEAKKICDQNPCTVIINKEKTTIYRSGFGKVNIPKKTETVSDSLKKILRAEMTSIKFNIQ